MGAVALPVAAAAVAAAAPSNSFDDKHRQSGSPAAGASAYHVARVGKSLITKREFDHWFMNAAASASPGRAKTVPKRPAVAKCAPGSRQGRAVRKQCRLVREVMRFLIQAEWVQQEADARGVEVTDAEVRKSFERKKKQAFPKARDYKRFLKDSGMSERDILFRVKLDLLTPKLTKTVTEGVAPVTDADVAAYYEKHRQRFVQTSPAKANKVIRALLRGEREKEALLGFIKRFRRAHRQMTFCRRGYVVSECSNGRGGGTGARAGKLLR